MNLLSGFFRFQRSPWGTGRKLSFLFGLAMSWGMWDLGSPNQGDQD